MEPQDISSMFTEFTRNTVNRVCHTIHLTQAHYMKGFGMTMEFGRNAAYHKPK
jgi:hypothetical protein